MSGVILQAVEEAIRQECGPDVGLNDYFDLVAGTSTGSILAAGVALGRSATDLLDLYKANGDNIFPARIRKMRGFTNISRGFLPIFLYPHEPGSRPDEGLATVLKAQLQPTATAKLVGTYESGQPVTISDIEKPVLVIPAYNTIRRRAEWFVSNNPSAQSMWYDQTEVWQFCVCSASAPTFFPPYQLYNPREKKLEAYIDGGVAVNNPALVAIAHALFLPYKTSTESEVELDDIAILSIGTGRPTDAFAYEEVKSWGLAKWALHLSDLFIPAPNDVADSVCWQLIRGREAANAKRVLRMDFDIETDDPADKVLLKIDNPDLYEDFERVATNYLNNGQVAVDVGRKLNPREAIREFIQANQP